MPHEAGHGEASVVHPVKGLLKSTSHNRISDRRLNYLATIANILPFTSLMRVDWTADHGPDWSHGRLSPSFRRPATSAQTLRTFSTETSSPMRYPSKARVSTIRARSRSKHLHALHPFSLVRASGKFAVAYRYVLDAARGSEAFRSPAPRCGWDSESTNQY